MRMVKSPSINVNVCLTLGVIFGLGYFQAANAQSAPESNAPSSEIERSEPIVPDLNIPEIEPLDPNALPEHLQPKPETTEPLTDIQEPETALKPDAPDYSHLSKAAEHRLRLNGLFERIGAETNADAANLIAEEIWAIWLDSGSESVNLLLRRGTAAEKRNQSRLARRMYNHVTSLQPDFAEGWSRSGRLALDEKDYSRALSEVTQALILEPRHFYALWTLGNIFEQLGRQTEALEAYKEANRLYPELKAVKDRLALMQENVEGDLL